MSEDKHPQITVVMATYNGGAYIAAQLDSILDQTLKPAAIIVSDDGSTDATLEILQKYEFEKLLCLHNNSGTSGVVGNFKHAASKANATDYIAFADQDDVWTPDKLQASMECLKAIEAENLPCMVYSDPMVMNAEGLAIHPSLWEVLGFNNYEHKLETVLFGNPVGGLTMLINPALAKYISTIPSNCMMHDAWLALCAYTFGKAAIVPGVLVHYRQHANNVTFSTNYKAESRFERVGKELLKVLKGKTDIFGEQFLFVAQFYEQFKNKIPRDKKVVFKNFLALKDKAYLTKKLAFRAAMKP